MFRAGPGVLLALLLIACSPAAPSPAPSPATRPASITETSTSVAIRLSESHEPATVTLDAPLERVWSIVPEVYQALGIPAEINDPGARVYGTRSFAQSRLGGKRTADYVRCGNEGAGPSAVSGYRVRLSVVSSLRSAPGGKTVLATEVNGSATPVEGTSTAAVRCASTGALEQRIHSLVSERAAG